MVEPEVASRIGAETTVASGTPPVSTAAALPRQLGSIRLIRPIGKGGMAEVWLAKHEILGRDVAVKVLSTTIMKQGDASWSEFIESARVAAARVHPGLNQVFHADIADGLPYLVLEYLDGPNLQEVIARSGRLDLTTARAVIEAVCGAVAELHQHDLVHRDLKPSNIMLTSDGQVVVTDFGLARATAAAALRANIGGVAGTPTYMAPEMFDGVVSARTDVYAIGMTAYQLLSGRPGFSGTFEELKQQHQTAPLDIEPLLAARVPPAVIEGITRATSKDVLFRPKSARHVLELFRSAFDSASIACATPVQIAALITRRPLAPPAPIPTTAPPPVSSGIWQNRLAALAGRRRDRRPKAEISATQLRQPAPVKNTDDFLLCKQAERRRMRIAGVIAALVGGVVGALMMIQIGRWVGVWQQWVNDHLVHAKTVVSSTPSGTTIDRATPLWASLIIDIVPIVILTLFTAGMSLLTYRLLRGRRLPEVSEKTKCGWCEHELRGISVPVCSECGHRIGDQGPDEQGRLPPGLRWGPWLRTLVAMHATFFLAWASIAMVAALILSFVIPGATMGGFGSLSITFLLAMAITLLSNEKAAQHRLSRSGLAWCRKCRNELRDLTAPVCPSCGERI